MSEHLEEGLTLGGRLERDLPEGKRHLVPLTLTPWELRLLAQISANTLPFDAAYSLTVALASPCCGVELTYTSDREESFSMMVYCQGCGRLVGREDIGSLRRPLATVREWDREGNATEKPSNLREALEEWLAETSAPTIALPLIVSRYEELLEDFLREELPAVAFAGHLEEL